MKKSLSLLFVIGIAILNLHGADSRPIVNSNTSVRVQYQIKGPCSNSWTTTNANLRGSISETMMINTLSQRHPRHCVRILAVYAGKNIRTNVRYQFRRGNSSWTTGTATLINAITESMAKNQLCQRHPNAEVRILSINSVK